MKHATCRSSTCSLKKAKRIYHGPKIGATNLEAGLLILVSWPLFWVQNLAPVLGPQNTNRSYSIRAASVLLPPQADSSTYPWYPKGTCPRSLLYHLFEAPVLGPWAHLGFEKKRPLIKNAQRHEVWIANGLDVKLLSTSRKTTKARVANHNGLGAKLLKGLMKNYAGVSCKSQWLGRKTTKNVPQNWRKEEDTISCILWSIFLVVLRPSQYELRNCPE